MTFQLYDTMSRSIREFRPLVPGAVSMHTGAAQRVSPSPLSLASCSGIVA